MNRIALAVVVVLFSCGAPQQYVPPDAGVHPALRDPCVTPGTAVCSPDGALALECVAAATGSGGYLDRQFACPSGCDVRAGYVYCDFHGSTEGTVCPSWAADKGFCPNSSSMLVCVNGKFAAAACPNGCTESGEALSCAGGGAPGQGCQPEGGALCTQAGNMLRCESTDAGVVFVEHTCSSCTVNSQTQQITCTP